MRSRPFLRVIFAAIGLFLTAACLAQTPSPSASPLDSVQQLIWKGQYVQAIAQLKTYLVTHPGSVQAHLLFGAADYATQNYTGAYPELEQVLKQQPENQEAVKLMGLDAYFLARPKEAIPYLLKVRQWMPNDVDLQYLLAVCYVQTDDLRGARDAAAHMLGIDANSAPAALALAKVLIQQKMEAKAVPQIEAALKADPHLPRANFMLGEMDIYHGRYTQAQQDFMREIAINPTFARAFYRLGDADFRLGQLDAAKGALSRSIWLDPTYSGPYILMGELLLRQGDAALADRMLAHALKLDPNNYDAHYIRGRALQKLGQTKEAALEFALSQKLRPPVEGNTGDSLR